MSLNRLIIQNFRNIRNADLSFSPNLNLFIGVNGSGKTSLLESIYTLGHGRAFRTSLTQRVIQNDAEQFTLFGTVEQNAVQASSIQTSSIETHSPQTTSATTTKLGLQKDRTGTTKVKINGEEGQKIAQLAQSLPMQLITPEGFSLIDGGPKYRRAYLDWGCFHHFPDFFNVWYKCKRLLKQRNAALRQVRNYQELLIWDQELIPVANLLTKMREDYTAHLVEYLAALCTQFLPQFSLEFNFYEGWNQNHTLDELFVKQFERDRLLGYSSVGPQKADLRITVEQYSAENVLSRGQLKLLMCALRLAQGELFSKQRERACIYLIDDLSSELDEPRRELLAHCLEKQTAQLFITTLETRSTELFRSTFSRKSLFVVSEGQFTNFDIKQH